MSIYLYQVFVPVSFLPTSEYPLSDTIRLHFLCLTIPGFISGGGRGAGRGSLRLFHTQ
jgi:hypothetical protein